MRTNKSVGTDVNLPMMVNVKKSVAHPGTGAMVMEAVAKLNKMGGVSLSAIKKYISEVYKVDAQKKAYIIRKAVTMAVADGKIVQTKGTGANGRFKLPLRARDADAVEPNHSKPPRVETRERKKTVKFGNGTKKRCYECGICGLNFSTMEPLRKHRANIHNLVLPGGTIQCQSDTLGSSRKVEAEPGTSLPSQQIDLHVKEEEIEVPLLQPELEPIVDSEPEDFVFVDYLKNSTLDEDGTAMPIIPTDIRVFIIDALEFHDPGISCQLINSYLEETFNVKTDCSNVLDEMVREGILKRTVDGKYSKRKIFKLGPVDEEKQVFDRLIREILTTADDSPLKFTDIQKCMESRKKNWFFPLHPRIKRFLQLNVKNGSVVRICDKNVYKYRFANSAGLQDIQSNDDEDPLVKKGRIEIFPSKNVEKPLLGIQKPVNKCSTPLFRVNQCSPNQSPQILEPESHDFKCKYCGQLFLNKKRLTSHVRSHSKDAEGRRYKCSTCNAGFHQKSQLTEHSEQVHLPIEKLNVPSNDELSFECGLCPINFSSIDLLSIHIEQTHKSLENVLECGMCPETFVNHVERLKHSLQVHKKHTHHLQWYTCKTCGFRSRSCIRNFYDHFNGHTDAKYKPRKRKCPVCNMVFFDSKQLKSHFKSVHQSRKCNVRITQDPDLETFIKSEPGTVENHSDTIGNQSYAIGSHSEVIGNQSSIKFEDIL